MKKKLLIILISLLVSLLFVLFKLNFSQSLKTKEYGITGLLENTYIENLYIGSSMFKQGIDPEEIGENDYILAYNGNEPSNILRELEYILSQDNIHIKNIYIDMYAWTVVRGPWIDDLNILWDCDFKTIKNIFCDLKENANLLYTYEYFVSSNNDYLLTFPISSKIINSFFYKGGNSIKSYSKGDDYLNSLDPCLSYSTNDINQKQVDAINSINTLCINNNIHLIFIETPKYITEAQYDRYIIVMNEYKDLLNSLEIQYIMSADLDFDNCNSSYFIDLVHMSSDGANYYTKTLIDYIKNNY